MAARLTSLAVAIGFVALLVLAGALSPTRSEPATDCFSEDHARRFAGCTAIIESPAFDPIVKSQAYASRALIQALQQKYEAAIQDYDAAIALDPASSTALNNRAWAYHKWGRGRDGLADVEKSLRLNPASEHTWDTRAHIRQTMGNHAGAFADYEQAVVIGGQRMVKLYQCGLSASGLYRGRFDGIYSDQVKDALKMCANSRTCDPLPADEECRDPVS